MSQVLLFGGIDDVPTSVPLSDRWRTPAGVLAAPLELLGRESYDLDAAAEPLAHVAEAWLGAHENSLTCEWWPHEDDLVPLVWLNPPFSKACGGKAAWIRVARAQAQTGLIVCLYLPAYADTEVAALDGVCACRITIVGRVQHHPPPGLDVGDRPDRHQHAIWILTPEAWAGPMLLAWDYKARSWVGREP